jgi:hypothetical protein
VGQGFRQPCQRRRVRKRAGQGSRQLIGTWLGALVLDKRSKNVVELRGFEPPDLLHAIQIFIVSQCGRMWLYQQLYSLDVARRSLVSPLVCSPLAPRLGPGFPGLVDRVSPCNHMVSSSDTY